MALSTHLVMSLIDLAMIGTLGNRAVGAAGLASFSYALVLAVVGGLAPAVQGITARRRGEGSTEPKCLPLNGGLLLSVVIGLPLTVICWFVTPFFFRLISSDPQVTATGIPYLQVLYLSIIATGMHRAFQGYWSGIEKPKIYMAIVFAMVLMNVGVNYALIFGNLGFPALGATGAAIGTVVALYAGLLVNFGIAWVQYRHEGFLKAKPEPALLKRIFRISIPPAMQQFFFSAGYVVYLWLVGQVGTAELAAANVLVRISLVLLILATAVGMASATLVSRTLGEGDHEGAAQWGWDSAKLGVIGISLLALPVFLFPKYFLAIFLTDPNAIAIALVPMRLVAATAGLGSLIYIFAYTLYSVGDGNRVTMISFGTQWLFFLPAVWFVGPHLNYGLLEISFVQVAYGAIATMLVTSLWAGGKWKGARA
ncbi:MAG TPA: MATE family efflux transporter [Thermoanaerobaculia bacterium]